MQDVISFFKAVGVILVVALVVLVVALVIAFTVSNPWVMVVILVAASILTLLGFIYVVHVLVDLIGARHHQFRLRRLEAEARADEIEGQRTARIRQERLDAEQFRLQWYAQEMVPIGRGEALVSRQGGNVQLVYEPRMALPAPTVVDAQPVDTPTEVIPDALMVIKAGDIPQGDDLLLGYDAAGQPVVRAWKKVKAILILGLQGGGKTSTAIWLLLQVVLKGGHLGLIDKHARSEEDSMYSRLRLLRAAFDVPVGDSPLSAMRVVQHARKVLDDRLAGGHIAYPFLLVVDEFTAIMRQKSTGEAWAEVAQKLQGVLEDYNTEGRKHRCFAICIGQAANASRSGGTEVRDLFNTRIVHRMRAKQAQMLSLTDEQDQIGRLGTGQVCVDMETDDPFFLTVPFADDDALKLVAESLQQTAHFPPTSPLVSRSLAPFSSSLKPTTSRHLRVRTEGAEAVRTGTFNPINAQALHPDAHLTERLFAKAEKVLDLRRLNVGKHTIVPEVWGISKGGSAAYKQACEEYERILRYLVARGELPA